MLVRRVWHLFLVGGGDVRRRLFTSRCSAVFLMATRLRSIAARVKNTTEQIALLAVSAISPVSQLGWGTFLHIVFV
ncbi:hypothetical protein HYQ46_013234 [Verticillium longisporum]|nr:hypothetical protein HYQ46_013234 [Verticillium longisporum]